MPELINKILSAADDRQLLIIRPQEKETVKELFPHGLVGDEDGEQMTVSEFIRADGDNVDQWRRIVFGKKLADLIKEGHFPIEGISSFQKSTHLVFEKWLGNFIDKLGAVVEVGLPDSEKPAILAVSAYGLEPEHEPVIHESIKLTLNELNTFEKGGLSVVFFDRVRNATNLKSSDGLEFQDILSGRMFLVPDGNKCEVYGKCDAFHVKTKDELDATGYKEPQTINSLPFETSHCTITPLNLSPRQVPFVSTELSLASGGGILVATGGDVDVDLGYEDIWTTIPQGSAALLYRLPTYRIAAAGPMPITAMYVGFKG